MGTRATPGGEDRGSATPGRRSAKQLQQNALTRPRSGRRGTTSAIPATPAEAGSPAQPVVEKTVVDRPAVAQPSTDQRPRTRPVRSRTAKPVRTPGATPARSTRRSKTADSAKKAGSRRPSRTPSEPERGAGRTHLVDETEIDGPSDVEVDVTPAELVTALEEDGHCTAAKAADEPGPRSRREAREDAQQDARRQSVRPRGSTRSRKPAGPGKPAGRGKPTGRSKPAGRGKPRGPVSPGGTRRPAGLIGRLTVVGKWQPQNRKAWGAAIATALVLLIPGTTLLSPSDPIVDGTLNSSNGNLYGTTPTLDATTQDALVPTKKPEDTQKTKHLTKPKQGDSPVDNSMPKAGDDTASPTAGDGKGTGNGTGTGTGNGTGKPKASSSPSPRPTKKPAPKKAEPSTPSAGNGKVASVAGLGWASGAFIQGDSAAKMREFAQWRGRGMNVVVTYTARSNWTDTTTGFDWLLDAWKNTDYTVVVGVPPFPENSGGSLSDCASGSYNDKWKTFARTMKSSGYSDRIIIRLGWEFNGGWYEWSAKNPSAFAECWRQVVGTVEEIAPALRWDWNVNRGPSDGLEDAKAAWPGDSYVDIVGVDSYDWYPGVHNEDDWNKHVDGDQGLNYWLKFARAHGKKLSFPEWGLYTGAGGGVSGGDNPYYIKKMMAYFKSIKSDLAYESYFNDDSDYIKGSLFGPDQNPDAANTYKDVYSAG